MRSKALTRSSRTCAYLAPDALAISALAACFTGIQEGSVATRIPILGDVSSYPHPHSGKVGEQANRAEAAVGFGQEDDDDYAHLHRPYPRPLTHT